MDGRGSASPLGRTAGVEDLEAAFHFVQRKVAVAENDGVGGREASVQARQPAFGRAAVMSYHDGSPVDLDLQFGRQRALQRCLIDIAVHGMDDLAEILIVANAGAADSWPGEEAPQSD